MRSEVVKCSMSHRNETLLIGALHSPTTNAEVTDDVTHNVMTMEYGLNGGGVVVLRAPRKLLLNS